MPATIGSKPPEPAKKKLSGEVKEMKEAKRVELVKVAHHENDYAAAQLAQPSQPPQPAQPPQSLPTEGEPVKKPTARKRVSEEKKGGSSVVDRVPPKTKAQRAKGSIALNKALEKTDSDSAGKKQQTSSRSTDRLSRPNTREGGALGEGRRGAVAVRSKGKVKTEGSEPKSARKKKPWVAVVEKASNVTLNEKAMGVVEQESKEVKNEEMRPMNTASNSCSFFEKLQQGMRAYFCARNSFNPPSLEEKNQKKVTEGGIRTRARVGKGVKEDRKKTKPGKVVKNKKYSSESDLWYNRFRVKSSLGGQSNTSLKAKPKISRQFRKLKRKKLYCPIKHCVRIQIPRKGYFYRSTVRFKAPGSAPSSQRMEYDIGPQSKSKVQIPRLAPASPKVPSLRKKRLKKNQKDSKLVPRSATPVEHAGSALDEKVAVHRLGQGAATSSVPPLTSLEDYKGKPPKEASPRQRGGRQIRGVLASPVSGDNDMAKKQIKKGSKGKGKRAGAKRGADGAAGTLETSSERVISLGRIGVKPSPPSDASFDTLMSCLSSVLGRDDGLYDLQITPVITGGGESSLEREFQMLAAPPGLQITEVVSAFENLDDADVPEADGACLSPTFQELSDGGDFGFATEDNIAKMLIGEIDLHLELENYLREIEHFNGVKSRTKNTLQCNLYKDCCPLEALQNRTSDFETLEITSNSTFESATSVCTQQDGDTAKLHVFLDRKHDLASMSEEHFDPRNTKVFISQTQVTDKVGDIRKIKSENDPKKMQQESKLKSSIKRTYGKTSFQSSRADEENAWALLPLRSDQSTDSSVDSYEKILPFGWHSSKSCDEKRNSLSGIDSKSLSTESLPRAVRNCASEADGCRGWAEEAGNEEVQLPEDSSLEEVISGAIPQVQSKRRLWSPSLQELIEIYNNVLKHNKKIRSNSRTSVSRCISSHLFSFLNEELKEKECKANLMLLSENLKKKLKGPRLWKPGRQQDDNNTLEEYVTMFQEVLKSSLSIKQIARLNNIMSGLQEYSEKNYDLVKNMDVKEKEEMMRKIERFPKLETIPKLKSEMKKKLVAPRPKVPKKQFLTDKPIRLFKTPLKKSKVRRRKAQATTEKAEEALPMEEITKIDLTSPTELESILQSCLVTEDVNSLHPRGPQDKVLVTVKLRGNQVLVSKLMYFSNEQALTPGKTKENGTSELIIENVTKERSKSIGRKDTENEMPRESIKLVEAGNRRNETKIKVEPKKVQKRRTAVAAAPEAKKNTFINDRDNRFFLKELEQPETLHPFEYDQMQLRAQHPIEAIIESSESKLSDHIESSDDDGSHPLLEPPPEKKILLKDIHNKTTLKEALLETLGENINWKDLSCDFGPHDQSLARAKSYVISREALKKQTVAQEPTKHAETVRSLTDLVTKAKNRRKPRRKGNYFLVYPSILSLQRKAPSAKKKSKKQPRYKNHPLCISHPRTHSNNAMCPPQDQVLQRPSKEFGSEASLSDQEAAELSCLVPAAKGSDESSADTVARKSEGKLVDGCSLKLLYYDDEDPAGSVSPKVSASMVKTASKTVLSEQVAGEGKSNRALALAVEGVKGSSMVIQPPRDASEDTILHSVMIHSDSFLKKCYSSLALTQANLNCFLKTCSDMKFYPGRVSSSDKQQSPFVKFVLTPSQNAGAELPSDQVQVVDRRLAAENAVVEHFNEEGADPAGEEIDEKIPLISIEKFIKRLSKAKKKGKSRPMDPAKPGPEERKKTPIATSKMSQRKRGSFSDQQPRPKAIDRKPYHECQKRRLNGDAKPPEKRAKTADCKPKPESRGKPQPRAENTQSLLFLKKFVLTLSQVMESFSREEVENAVKLERRAATGELDPSSEGMRTEGRAEKGTNTTPDTPLVRVQAVKSAVTQTEDVLCVKGRMEEGCKRGAGGWNPGDSGPTTARQANTVKIKIHCDERSNSKAGKSEQQRAKSPAAEKPQLMVEKLGLLDSLVMGEPEGGCLERRGSVYFDAVDYHSDEESEGLLSNREEEVLAHWATVDPVSLSTGSLLKDKSDGSNSFARTRSCSPVPEMSAERVFDEILKSLQDDKICHSLRLLDDFLGRTELSASWGRNSDRLRNVLLLVSSKSKNLILGMEKSAWLKVLSLLEDITQKFGSEHEDSQSSQRAFTEKTRMMSDNRLIDLQNYCSSLSLTTTESNSKNIFCRVKDFLNYLRNTISPQRSPSNDSIHSTVYLTAEAVDQPPKNPLHHFRKQIQKQRSYIEFLHSANGDALSQEVRDVERRKLSDTCFRV